MEVLKLISAVASSLNAAPSTTLADVVQVVNTLTTFLETLHKQQNAAKTIPSPAASVVTSQASPTSSGNVSPAN